ncbi:MAG: substrate-binding domain-containing protein [Bacilli bacterium]
MKKISLIILTTLLIFAGCSSEEVEKEVEIKMSTTTSLNDSGLLDVLTEEFYKETNIKVSWVSVGSGEAMEIAKSGDVELAFLHSPAAEEEFVAEGYSKKRNIVMSNNFLIVGPEEIEGTREEIVAEITQNRTFVSRDDNSGTHKKELEVFATTPNNYIRTGLGMGDTLLIADEKDAYTIIDKATWVANKNKVDLVEVYNNPQDLKNIYSIHQIGDNEDAKAFIDFIYSDEGQKIIAEYGIEQFGEAVYILE